MKRIGIVLLTLLFALCLCACAEEGPLFAQKDTFPEETTLLGIDLAGMEHEEAWSALEAAVEGYTLNLTVDGIPVTVSGADMDISLSRDVFMAGADALKTGSQADFTRLVRYSDAKLRLALGRQLNKPMQEAAIVYDNEAGAYRLDDHAEGLKTHHNALAATLRDVIRALTPEHTCTGFVEVLYPTWTADSQEAQAILEKVNQMAQVQLCYDFGTAEEPMVHQIPTDIIRSLITLGEDGFQPSIDMAAATAYAKELAALYNTAPTTGPFPTTGGEVLDMVLPYHGCYINTDALAYDISLCAGLGYSGVRNVPYEVGSVKGKPYGGTYVEVDLTNQHLWYYKNGECLVDTDLVSGNVALNMHTPTGNFYIYSRSRNIYLEGEDYRSFVSYWMPFTGGYGLHDATWRNTFGGELYLNDGSHGCVNLPPKAAATLYNNSGIGTRVILYGGEGCAEPRQQEIRVETERTVTADTESFKLGARSKYAWPEFFYQCDNPEVATVAADGTVSVHGVGTAKITVTAATEGYYDYTQTVVTICVICPEDTHQMGQPVMTTEATCQSGVQTSTCTNCNYTEEVTLEPVYDHTFEEGVCTVCGETQ